MSQTDALFDVLAPVTVLAATTSAPAAIQLPKAGETLRIVNTGNDAGYVAIADTAAGAVATLPTNGSLTSCYAGPGADFTVSIKGDQRQFASAIMSANTANILLYVGKGS